MPSNIDIDTLRARRDLQYDLLEGYIDKNGGMDRDRMQTILFGIRNLTASIEEVIEASN